MTKIIIGIVIALIIVFVVAISEAKAYDEWATPNEWFGQVVITPLKCKKNPELKYAYGYTGDMIVSDACWILKDSKVHIFYDDGRHEIYDAGVFHKKGFFW